MPTITVSEKASISPSNNLTQDFSNPVIYAVTAEDSSMQNYTVTVVVAPDPNPIVPPDTTPPSITSYTLNGSADNITTNPLVSPVILVMTANKNVNWTSVEFEKQNADTHVYKIYKAGSGCVNGTNTCTKTWDGILSSGELLGSQNGTYRIKVHIKDTLGNEFYDYLIPYTIEVNTTN